MRRKNVRVCIREREKEKGEVYKSKTSKQKDVLRRIFFYIYQTRSG